MQLFGKKRLINFNENKIKCNTEMGQYNNENSYRSKSNNKYEYDYLIKDSKLNTKN